MTSRGFDGIGVKILVIDDDAVDRERVRRLLARASLRASVMEEAEPIRALARLKQLAPELVLLDYSFPGEDGLSILRKLREIDPVVPVIMLTGHEETTLAVELMKSGAADYLSKNNLTAERLAQSVRHGLRLRASELAARAAEEALRASEELSRRVLEASHDSIKVLDLDARLLATNPGGHDVLTSHGLAHYVGKPWLELWPSDHRGAAQGAIDEARAGRKGRFVGRRPTNAGEMRWWDVVITPVLGADGKPDRLVASSRDVTDQKVQAEFEQQLIGIVSHDLRNPITAMIMSASLLLQKMPAESPLQLTAMRIIRSGERATRLISDLLDFTHVRLGGGLPVEPKPSNIHQVCNQVVEEVGLNHPDRSVVLVANGEGDGTWDPDRLSQMVANLVRNAVSYSAPGTSVTVHSTGAGPNVRVEVHNQGEPIASDVIPSLFEPFKRGAKGQNSGHSIGLGLFIVRQVVTAHGGCVEVRSTADAGTTFCVELPRSA